MKNRKFDEKATKQVVIDAGLHKLVKIEATEVGGSIREAVESALAEYFGLDKPRKIYEKSKTGK